MFFVIYVFLAETCKNLAREARENLIGLQPGRRPQSFSFTSPDALLRRHGALLRSHHSCPLPCLLVPAVISRRSCEVPRERREAEAGPREIRVRREERGAAAVHRPGIVRRNVGCSGAVLCSVA